MDLSADLYWSDIAYLKACERLRSAGWTPELIPGLRVARGFADLGYEEFLILPNGKLLSIFSGTMSESIGDAKHLFVVPDIAILLRLIEEASYRVDQIVNKEDRNWEVFLSANQPLDQQSCFEGDTIASALIEAAISLYKPGI